MYAWEDIGEFPERLKPENYYPDLTSPDLGITYRHIYHLLDQLQLTIYQPSLYIHLSKIATLHDIDYQVVQDYETLMDIVKS